jgi:hypothetical protein
VSQECACKSSSLRSQGMWLPHAGRTSTSSENYLQCSARRVPIRGQSIDFGIDMVRLRRADDVACEPISNCWSGLQIRPARLSRRGEARFSVPGAVPADRCCGTPTASMTSFWGRNGSPEYSREGTIGQKPFGFRCMRCPTQSSPADSWMLKLT